MSRLVQKVFEDHDNWISKFVIDGQEYGGSYDVFNDPRIKQFWENFPDAKKILELGCLEGGHTVQLAEKAKVVAIEGKKENFDKAKEIIRIHKNNFHPDIIQANLETFSLTNMGRFDVVFCVGVLYHLKHPLSLLQRISEVSDGIFIWTHCCNPKNIDTEVDGYKGRIHKEPSIDGPVTGMSHESFWPTLTELVRMITDCGYRLCQLIKLEDTEDGDCKVTISVKRD